MERVDDVTCMSDIEQVGSRGCIVARAGKDWRPITRRARLLSGFGISRAHCLGTTHRSGELKHEPNSSTTQ